MVHRVLPNKTIVDAAGTKFVVRGTTMFDYNFVSYESHRTDWGIRVNSAITVANGTSPPTGYARYQYIDAANVSNQLSKAKSLGVNLIRVAVEPAMLNTLAYVDPSDGKTYISDMDQLDIIIEAARVLDIVVQLQNGNDRVPISLNVSFLSALVTRYKGKSNVWINPCNELNGANDSGNVSNVSIWTTTHSHYVSAIRSAGWVAPIVINPTDYGRNLNGVVGAMAADPVLSTDTNLIIGVHVYPREGEHNFIDARLPDEYPYWIQYLGQHCIIVDEFGINNYGQQFDPNLNPDLPQGSSTTWAQMQSFTQDFCNWAFTKQGLSGITGFMWYAYIPGMAQYDLNTLTKINMSLTTWGSIFTNYYTSKEQPMDPTPTDGQWNTYAPLVSSTSGSVGAYTCTGRYFSISANLVFVQIYVNIQNNGTGAGAINITLPDSMGNVTGSDYIFNGAQIVNDFTLFVRTQLGTKTLKVKRFDGGYPSASGAQFLISGTYGVN